MHRTAGFSLLELMVAIAVLAVISATVYHQNSAALKQQQVLEIQSIAHWVGQARLEELKYRSQIGDTDQLTSTSVATMQIGPHELELRTSLIPVRDYEAQWVAIDVHHLNGPQSQYFDKNHSRHGVRPVKFTRGFTLLEMIVAVGIFGLIGLLAGQLLTQSIQVTEKVLFRGERLNEIQRAIQIVEWDIRQLTHRQIRNEYGEIMPALVNSGGASIEFTRRGFINATGEQRSNLQRVQYYVQEGNLMRRFWTNLDRAHDTPYVDQTLLKQVFNIKFNVIDNEVQARSNWPLPFFDPEEEPLKAIAITLSLSVDLGAEMTLGWMIPEHQPFAGEAGKKEEKTEDE